MMSPDELGATIVAAKKMMGAYTEGGPDDDWVSDVRHLDTLAGVITRASTLNDPSERRLFYVFVEHSLREMGALR